jgi:hypothetical protein
VVDQRLGPNDTFISFKSLIHAQTPHSLNLTTSRLIIYLLLSRYLSKRSRNHLKRTPFRANHPSTIQAAQPRSTVHHLTTPLGLDYSSHRQITPGPLSSLDATLQLGVTYLFQVTLSTSSRSSRASPGFLQPVVSPLSLHCCRKGTISQCPLRLQLHTP